MGACASSSKATVNSQLIEPLQIPKDIIIIDILQIPEENIIDILQIPEDIIIDVYLRLPIKSLVRLKFVCKTWYNLIKSPSFISMHGKSSTVSQLLICTSNVYKKSNHVFSFRSNDKHPRVLSPDLEIPDTHEYKVYVAGSCNGIVCYFDYSGRVFLSNPATREFKKWPPTSIDSDLNLGQFGVGFGFDSSSIYDFKVLRVFGVHTIVEHAYWCLEMFTLSSNTWRPIECGLDKSLKFLEPKGVFWANSFHFLAKSPGSFELTIVRLEIHTEKVTRMDFPSKADHLAKGNLISLMVVKEFLSVLFTDPGIRGKYGSVEIWIMNDYGVVESWTKLCRIETSLGFSRALCFVRMDEHALLLVEDERDKLVTCDLNSLHFGGFKVDGYKRHSEVVVHKESLVSIMRHI